MPTITALNIYPVKSCRGIALTTATLASTGLQHDREWMIIRPDGRFVTQRELPRLALITPSIDGMDLVLGGPDGTTRRVPMQHDGEVRYVTVWRDTCAAIDAGDEVAAWLEAQLGASLRLVRFHPDHRRLSSLEWTGGIEAANQFTDGYPILVISEESLADLNSRLEAPLPMNRFRPNVVIAGVDAYGEDKAQELLTSDVRLRVVKPCTRCAITTTEQSEGVQKGPEPIRTLKSYRLSRNPPGVLFGQNAIIVDGVGRALQVGQSLDVIWK